MCSSNKRLLSIFKQCCEKGTRERNFGRSVIAGCPVRHRRPRDETIVLGQPRGPKTEMQMTPADAVTTVEPAGLKLAGVIELPPYHYAAIFAKPASPASSP